MPPWVSMVSKPSGRPHDKIVGLGVLRRLDHLLLRGVRAAPEKVLPNGPGEEHIVLQHHADAVPELLQGIVPNIQPVQQDRASGDVIEPGDQIDQRGLARPRAAHDGHKLAGLHGEADLREYIVSPSRRGRI